MANLASFRYLGSNLEPVCGKAVVLAWLSPKISMEDVSSLVTVLTPPPPSVKLVTFLLEKGTQKIILLEQVLH